MNAKVGASGIGTSENPELPENFHLNDVTLSSQLQLLWMRKWLVVGVVLLSAVTFTAASFLVTPTYDASVLLMPVSQGAGGLNSLISKLGGLANLAGLSSTARGKEAEEVAFLKSRLLIRDFIEENKLLPILYQGQWNPKAKMWRRGLLGSQPTLWKAVKRFRSSILRVSTNTDGLVTLYVAWKDPAEASRWANGLVTMTNDHFRQDAVEEHKRNIEFLTAAAARATAVEVKEGIYSLLTEEYKSEMLAKGTSQFAFKVVDPAVSPEEPSSPKRIVWLLVGAILGFVITAGVVITNSDQSHRR